MFKALWQQNFPPKPTFIEKDVPPGSQQGKVYIITGANQGIGFELVKMLYPSGATIYLAGRSQQRVENAIAETKSTFPSAKTPAQLKYLHLDLADLGTIKASATQFASQETKLDILWNNAGIGGVPKGAVTEQGIEGHVGINCIGPLLFTQCLHPLLKAAALSAPRNSVRVIWTASLLVDTRSPEGGVDYHTMEMGPSTDPIRDYAISKAGNWLLADETAKRWGADGIVSTVLNPGNVLTNKYEHQSKLLKAVNGFLLSDAKMGAYTLLYAGFSPDLSLENNGAYVWPFGRTIPNVRKDIHTAIAQGKGKEFWEWCESQSRPYAAIDR